MRCGDATIDGLLAADASVQPLTAGSKMPAVGLLQDLLRGHGFDYLPDPRLPGYASYDSTTCRAVGEYRREHGLIPGNEIDARLLQDIVRRPAVKPALGQAYATLVLDAEFTPVLRFVWLTSLFETGGRFARLNLNTDQCGVSFGILQWSQKPGQFHNFLNACSLRQPKEWARIMGSEGPLLLEYTARPNGGLDVRGCAVHPEFELTRDPWKARLQQLGLSVPVQRIQLELAAESYRVALDRMRDRLRPNASERMIAFLLDLANQFGPGRVEQTYQVSAADSAPEVAVMRNMEYHFTALSKIQFQAQVRARREFFRGTTLLSDAPLA